MRAALYLSLLLSITAPAEADIFIVKSFNPRQVPVGGVARLRVQLSNVTPTTASLTDVYPAGLVNDDSEPVVNCPGATVVAVPGQGSFTIAGASLGGGVCTFDVFVTAPTEGLYKNDIPPGAVISTTGETNDAPGRAWLNVGLFLPIEVAKSFASPTVVVGQPSRLTLTFTNPNYDEASDAGSRLSGFTFTDEFPAGLIVAPVPNVTGNCGSVIADPGDSSVQTFESAVIGEECTLSLDVVATQAGSITNVIPAGAVTASNTRPSAFPATATVVAVPAAAGAAAVPALSPLHMAILALLLAATAALVLRR